MDLFLLFRNYTFSTDFNKILQNDATSKYSPKIDNQSIFVSYAPDVITMFKFGVIDFATSFQIAKFFMQIKAP